ncbi:MAG: hypothetical protein CL561_06635 [Alphaproteobacteria bacterium]|nr:hypothetical protein [Alphaproteobacteria bacterium]
MVSLALLKGSAAAHAPEDFIKSLKCNYAFVARNAQHIEINYDMLESYARNLPKMNPDDVLDSAHHFISDNDESNISFIIALDSMNFGSGFQDQLKREGYDQPEGFYFKVAEILKAHYEQNGPLTAQALSTLSAVDIAKLLQLPDISVNPYSFRLASSYSSSVKEVGAYILSQHGGSFSAFIESCAGSSENFVYALSRLASYNDTCAYRGQRVPFYKRAISCAADLQDMFDHKGQELFNDIDVLPCLADCDIPHVLRVDGILKYDEELSEIVDNKELIEAGCAYEIELRACAVHAVEMMAAKSGRSAIELDRILWHRAQEEAYKVLTPHRSETKFY